MKMSVNWDVVGFNTILAQNLSRNDGGIVSNFEKNCGIKGRNKARNDLIETEKLSDILCSLSCSK